MRERFNTIWKDPVWSKVIATVIIGIGVFLMDKAGDFFDNKEKQVDSKEIQEKVNESKTSNQKADTLLSKSEKKEELNKNNKGDSSSGTMAGQKVVQL